MSLGHCIYHDFNKFPPSFISSKDTKYNTQFKYEKLIMQNINLQDTRF